MEQQMVLLVGAISYGVSSILYISTAQELGAIRAQIVFLTSPFWGLLIAYLLLGEQIFTHAVIAIIFLAFPIGLISKTSHEHAHVHPALMHTHRHYPDVHHRYDHTP